MKETIREALNSLIREEESEVKRINILMKEKIKQTDWNNVIVCQESIFHKQLIIKKLRKILQ